MLAVIAGLLRPDAGRVVLDGSALLDTAARIWVPPERRRCGVVFQDARLPPHLSVATNLRYGARRAPRGDGPGFEEVVAPAGAHEVFGTLLVGPTPILARVTRDAVGRLGLAPGLAAWALVKGTAFDHGGVAPPSRWTGRGGAASPI